MGLDASVLLRAAIGLLPVLCLLLALVALDSYKLVRPRQVLGVIAAGALAAGLCYFVNRALLESSGLPFAAYSRYAAPLVEEFAKAVVIVILIRTHRIGFLVDAAIFGFAVGTGFALVENLYYLNALADAHVAVWLVRGFGTALLHGNVQAIFAVLVLALADRRGNTGSSVVLPPLLFAAVVHSAFNHFVLPPVQQTLLVLVLLPPLLVWTFARSERSVEGWLGSGFDADRELLALLDSGNFTESPAGRYLDTLRGRFQGLVVADLLCYLRLHVELALRAKGLLMLREQGIEVEMDESTHARFEEMRHLERTVGPTALRAVKPLLHLSRRDLWQLYMLGK